VKKFFVLLCVLVLVTGFVVADDIGLTVAADFSIDNLTKANDDGMGPYLTPSIEYNTSFGDTSFSARLGYNFDMYPDFKDLVQDADLSLTLGHTLSLGSASTLLLELKNDFNGFMVSPKADEGDYGVSGSLSPRVRFTQTTDAGKIYAQVVAPIGYLDDEGILLRSRLGWTSTFGLALYAQLDSSLNPMEMYQGWRAFASYTADSFFFDAIVRGWEDQSAGLQIGADFEYYLEDATFRVGGVFTGVTTDGMKIDITPGFDYSLGAIDFYVECGLGDITKKTGDMTINPAVGVSFSF
jgi:hypothetical protein